MKSNLCTLHQNAEHLDDVFNEVDKCAAYNDLSRKRWLQLRLLAEELTGMLPALLQWSKGTFWLENEDSRYELHVSLTAAIETIEQRAQLLDLSTSGKNAAAVGISGKIRSAIEGALLSAHAEAVSDLSCDEWTLTSYRSQARNEQAKWDELEKSIIGNLADDVIVAIRGKKVAITVIKTFWAE